MTTGITVLPPVATMAIDDNDYDNKDNDDDNDHLKGTFIDNIIPPINVIHLLLYINLWCGQIYVTMYLRCRTKL